MAALSYGSMNRTAQTSQTSILAVFLLISLDGLGKHPLCSSFENRRQHIVEKLAGNSIVELLLSRMVDVPWE